MIRCTLFITQSPSPTAYLTTIELGIVFYVYQPCTAVSLSSTRCYCCSSLNQLNLPRTYLALYLPLHSTSPTLPIQLWLCFYFLIPSPSFTGGRPSLGWWGNELKQPCNRGPSPTTTTNSHSTTWTNTPWSSMPLLAKHYSANNCTADFASTSIFLLLLLLQYRNQNNNTTESPAAEEQEQQQQW